MVIWQVTKQTVKAPEPLVAITLHVILANHPLLGSFNVVHLTALPRYPSMYNVIHNDFHYKMNLVYTKGV